LFAGKYLKDLPLVFLRRDRLMIGQGPDITKPADCGDNTGAEVNIGSSTLKGFGKNSIDLSQ